MNKKIQEKIFKEVMNIPGQELVGKKKMKELQSSGITLDKLKAEVTKGAIKKAIQRTSELMEEEFKDFIDRYKEQSDKDMDVALKRLQQRDAEWKKAVEDVYRDLDMGKTIPIFIERLLKKMEVKE